MRLLIAFILLIAVEANAADVYMSTTGTKTTGKSTVGDWTNSNCYSTFAGAFAAMSGGDTLTINDGTYSGDNNAVNAAQQPPSGTVGAPTIIKARNIPCDGTTTCSSPLKVIIEATVTVTNATNDDTISGARLDTNGSTASYHTWQGIHWFGNSLSAAEHTKFKQCAFTGAAEGNRVAIATGNYQLFEDVVIMGKFRYGVLNYADNMTTRNNLMRRVIVRQDWANKSKTNSEPIAGISIYSTNNIGVLNSIIIDSGNPADHVQADPTYFFGAIGSTMDGSTGVVGIGNIVINYFGPCMHMKASNTGLGTFTDNLCINTGTGIYANNPSTINRMSIFNVNRTLWTWAGDTQLVGKGMTSAGYYSWSSGAADSATISNSIVSGIYQGYALNSVAKAPDYFNYYGSLGVSGGVSPTNAITTNPVYSGSNTSGSIKYPIRVESGSSLKTGGSSGGQVGAEIMYKIGVDGTFYGETGWNVTQSDPLWPYPYEAWIKAELASMPSTITGSTMPSPTRGVASPTGKQLNGVDTVTLTSYIWEALGNQMPTNLYDGSSPPVSPTTTYGPRIQASGRFIAR